MICSFVEVGFNATLPIALSPRERQIATLVVQGLMNKEMAKLLNLSPRTIEMHRARMMHKIGAKNTADLLSRLRATP